MTLNTQSVSVTPGARYSYYLGGTYTPVGPGVGTHVHTHQQLVVYVGLDGKDEGRMLICPLVDWSMKFAPVEELTAVEPAVGKIIDLTRMESKGDGTKEY